MQNVELYVFRCQRWNGMGDQKYSQIRQLFYTHIMWYLHLYRTNSWHFTVTNVNDKNANYETFLKPNVTINDLYVSLIIRSMIENSKKKQILKYLLPTIVNNGAKRKKTDHNVLCFDVCNNVCFYQQIEFTLYVSI